MVKVMATGVFDILHPGHIYYLEEAKKLGDELVVVVARDSTVKLHKHEPITNEKMRLAMVQALKPVDKAVLGYEGDVYRIVKELKPDIIALGYDQAHNEEKIRADLEKLGLKVKVVRLPEFANDLSGTRRIIRKIIDWYTFQKKIEKVEK
ncbi:MAG: FAD synthase [Candidatus Thermoplasmatota archaeon]|nr:FAD synthase [Candidatus Thermoplasmatota archaeon]